MIALLKEIYENFEKHQPRAATNTDTLEKDSALEGYGIRYAHEYGAITSQAYASSVYISNGSLTKSISNSARQL
jgi:hypothetical protein